MNTVHKGLAAGRWAQLSFAEQMANIGSEIDRALNWKERGNAALADGASERALELIDLTLEHLKAFPALKEVARCREAWADFYFGENEYQTTAQTWKKYFLAFTYLARKDV